MSIRKNTNKRIEYINSTLKEKYKFLISMLFNSEGYFCEGEVERDWQFNMIFGRIILTNQELTLFRKTNISLTDTKPIIDKFTDGFKIPILKINKVSLIKKVKIFVVQIETTDGYLFSITIAGYRSSGKKEGTYLNEILNGIILRSN